MQPRRSQRIRVFESSIEKLGRILSNKWKIKVVFKHGECKTSGNIIYLPVLPDTASQDLMDAMQGHLDHETAHVVFTDFQSFQNIRRRDKKLFTMSNALEDPRVERRYIEMWRGAAVNLKRSREWSLQKMREIHEDKDPKTGKVTKQRPWDSLSDFGKVVQTIALLPCVNYNYDHWFLKEVIEPDIVERVRQCEDIIRQAVATEKTDEVVQFAGEIMKKLNEVEEEQQFTPPDQIPPDAEFVPPQSPQDATMFKKNPPAPGSPPKVELQLPDDDDDMEKALKQALKLPMQGLRKKGKLEKEKKQGNQPQGQGEPQAGEEEDEDAPGTPGEEEDGEEGGPGGTEPNKPGEEEDDAPGGAAGGGEEEKEQGEEPAPGGPEDDEKGEPAPTSGGPGSGQSTPRPMPPFKPRNLEPSAEDLAHDEEMTAREDMLRDAALREFKGTDSYLVYTTEGDVVEVIKDGDRVAFKDFMLEANRIVSVIRRKMARSMLATNQSRWEGGKLRGKINPRAVFRVPLGTSKHVFRSRVESEDYDTAVQIMVDHSGSMDDHKLKLAAQSAIILGEVCNQLGVAFSVCGFSTGHPHTASDRYEHANDDEQKLYTRWGNLWIGLYKDFGESWSAVNHKLINMVGNRKMNTYDGESLRYGALRLLNRPEKRKILFWLNDGRPEPNDSDDHSAHNEYAKQCGKEVAKLVELLAIGISDDSVKNFYDNWVVVNELSDLPEVCLTHLDSLLRKGKRLTLGGKVKQAR